MMSLSIFGKNKINSCEILIYIHRIEMFPYKYDYSIVMAYYNRKTQTERTLDKFEETYKKYSYEVIIVDDNSKPDHDLTELVKKYSFPINLIVISEQEKGGRLNPCSVYNKGFREANGKMVVIQNPECIHIGDLLGYLKHNLKQKEYLAFSAYNCTSEERTVEILNDIRLINDEEYTKKNNTCWYNHPTVRPVHYHFCAAMLNDNLKMLGGFSEEYAEGAWFDDNEILLSISHNLRLEIKTISPDFGFVIHQWHARDAESNFTQQHYEAMKEKNRLLFVKLQQTHASQVFEYPKLLHLYWDGSPFSYLNLLTVLSFNKYNYGWKVNVFCPKNPIKSKSWKGDEQKVDYVGKDYFDELKKIVNVNIHYIDFNTLPFKFKDASEVIKSDFFRLYVLNKYGGLWSDFDIIYTNNVINWHTRKLSAQKNMILYRYDIPNIPKHHVYPIGLFLSKKMNSVLTTILVNIHKFYNPDNYQCLGASMFQFLFNPSSYEQSKDILNKMKLVELEMADATCYLPIKWNELNMLYKDSSIKPSIYETNDNVFGIHWFNGAADSKNYCNNLDLDKLKESEAKCLVDELVKQYI